MIKKIFALIIISNSYSLYAAPNLKFCYEDQDSYPWVLKDGSGLNIEQLKSVAKKLELQINFAAVPWKRCLDDLKKGEFDGAFAASYKTERLDYGYYPTVDQTLKGKVDESKRLHTNQYSLYVLHEEQNIKWDGKEIKGTEVVGSLPGYSINDFLVNMKKRVDDGTRLPVGVLEKLLNKRFNAVALQDYRADYIISSSPQFKNKVKKLTPPLEKKPYYLMLSKKLVESDKILATKIWKAVEEIRESAEFKKQMNEYLKK